jgi:hypothetical protein
MDLEQVVHNRLRAACLRVQQLPPWRDGTSPHLATCFLLSTSLLGHELHPGTMPVPGSSRVADYCVEVGELTPVHDVPNALAGHTHQLVLQRRD